MHTSKILPTTKLEESKGSTSNAGMFSSKQGTVSNEALQAHRLVLLGDCSVGKSSLSLRFVKKEFYEYQESTIGAAFMTQTVSLDDRNVKLEIWDTAGQERYHSLAPLYYRKAQAALIVYDITSRESFIRAKAWVKELLPQYAEQITITLVGNKIDLADKRQVGTDEAKQYAEENQLLFCEASAKSGVNVNEIFKMTASKLKPQKQTNNIDFDKNPEQQPRKCCM